MYLLFTHFSASNAFKINFKIDLFAKFQLKTDTFGFVLNTILFGDIFGGNFNEKIGQINAT